MSIPLAYFRLILSLLFLGIAALTLLQAPNIFLWRFAILATEYGQWLIVVPLGLLLWECCSPAPNLHTGIVLCTVLSLLFFCYPSYQAWGLARYLPQQLAEAYGPDQPKVEAFSFRSLWLASRQPDLKKELLKFTTRDGTTLEMQYYHSAAAGTRPCIVVVHGGGWNSGNYRQLQDMNVSLAESGYNVAAINYRLSPAAQWPAPREDVVAALGMLREESVRLSLDPGKFVLLGRSAGGQIALATAYGLDDPGICGCISLYAPTDMVFAYSNAREDDILKSPGLIRTYMGGSLSDRPEAYREASPRLLVGPHSPPTLLIQGTRDELVWYLHAHRLQSTLLRQNRPVFLLEMPWATHAFDLNTRGPAGQLSLFAIRWFLDRVTQ